KLILQMKSGITINIPLTEIEQIARPACLACSDFANDYSDISAGGLGSDDGYTTIMVRSTIGREVYSGALNKGYIENAGDEPLFQNNTDNKKIKKLIHEYAEKKYQRAQRHGTIKKN
ncbi:MAG: Coenzyme F420 hydrogenase/dehydrogenase, beta subunit C-terminal domain, partial [Candidatus Stygibacter australis]|nr:Coenzyme F420 hydrogenase/dehydrogenase, beta subunit C-terminal domain [Candidatus Stygibacter australis]